MQNKVLNSKIELLSPAGDLESVDAALRFGADAVYLGGPFLQLRSDKAGFTMDHVHEAAERIHKAGKHMYVTVNSFAFTDELPKVGPYVCALKEAGADAIIVADIGVLTTAKEACPEMEVHVSTQINTTNVKSAEIYHKLGASRVVLARELSLKQVREFCERKPKDLAVEVFVHGAMCMSFSGRCLLSAYMSSRSGNRGECSQPCRWTYTLQEERRPGEYFPIEETEKGTAILSSRDLCAMPFLDRLTDTGICSLKIEGRMKSPFYIASVTNAYRMALDALRNAKNPDGKGCSDVDSGMTGSDFAMNRLPEYDAIAKELCAISHRPYTAGFYFAQPGSEEDQAALGELLATGKDDGEYIRERTFVGVVASEEDIRKFEAMNCSTDNDAGEAERANAAEGAKQWTPVPGAIPFIERNFFTVGEHIEILSPGRSGVPCVVEQLYDAAGNPVEKANHPLELMQMKLIAETPENAAGLNAASPNAACSNVASSNAACLNAASNPQAFAANPGDMLRAGGWNQKRTEAVPKREESPSVSSAQNCFFANGEI